VITKVYSHAQSLAQCHEWLNRSLPNAQRIPVGSNAQAAQLAAAEAGTAAIAGQAAAERYHLPELASNIEDEPNNTTRFVVLGRHDAGPSGRDKTSLIMSAHNQTGALSKLLAPFSDAGVSMTRLESRPARHTLWEYVFFVDVEGHSDDAAGAQRTRRAGSACALSEAAGLLPGRRLLSLFQVFFFEDCRWQFYEQSLPYIRAISPYQPGKPITQLAREMGLAVEQIVKLASNENPLGMSPKARVAVTEAIGSGWRVIRTTSR
jgi:hypothetical protein